MLLSALSQTIVPVFFDVHSELGYGFLENTYCNSMQIALQDRGLDCQREVPVAMYFRGRAVGDYRMDLVVANAVVLECKTASKIIPAHEAQLLNYLRATTLRLGYILNFGPIPTFKRLVYDSARLRNPTTRDQ